jgi:solute carrier family 25 phosphate transporter 3
LKEEGIVRGFYSGLGPILFKQIPYTIAKFVVYERVAESIYASMKTPKDKVSGGTQTAINLGSGLVAGLCAAVISQVCLFSHSCSVCFFSYSPFCVSFFLSFFQPADTLLSKINKQKGAEGQSITSRLVSMSKQLGFGGLMTGLGARLFMVGTLTGMPSSSFCSPFCLHIALITPSFSFVAGQFAIYGDIKKALGATNAVELGKKH